MLQLLDDFILSFIGGSELSADALQVLGFAHEIVHNLGKDLHTGSLSTTDSAVSLWHYRDGNLLSICLPLR